MTRLLGPCVWLQPHSGKALSLMEHLTGGAGLPCPSGSADGPWPDRGGSYVSFSSRQPPGSGW